MEPSDRDLEDWPLRWTFRPWILMLSGAGPHPVIRLMSLSACSFFISTYSCNIPSTINGLTARYKLRQTILRPKSPQNLRENPRELRRPRNNTRNSIAALPKYRWRYSCPGVSSLTPLWCPRCCGMSQDPLCDWHSKLHLDFEVLLPVLRRPNPVSRRLCGLRQFFDKMFCLPVGKAYRSEKGIRGLAYKSCSTDFVGEKMDTKSSCLEIHCVIQIPVALQSIAKIHSVLDEGVCRCWRQH